MGNPQSVKLQTHNLTRQFGGVTAVDQLDITIPPGHLVGLIGPNGAGKSTTLGMLAGTIKPSRGLILYQEQDVTAMPMHERARLGLIRTFQTASEFKRLTVLDNLLSAVPYQPGDTLLGALRGKRYWRDAELRSRERAEALLQRFKLAQHAHTLAGSLSGGQRRLVEIMRALMCHPDTLLLDEPMAGVHPVLAEEIGEHLLNLVREGMTIVMVEHELGLIDKLCDPVLVMADGRLLAQGSMAALRERQDVLEAYLVG